MHVGESSFDGFASGFLLVTTVSAVAVRVPRRLIFHKIVEPAGATIKPQRVPRPSQINLKGCQNVPCVPLKGPGGHV